MQTHNIHAAIRSSFELYVAVFFTPPPTQPMPALIFLEKVGGLWFLPSEKGQYGNNMGTRPLNGPYSA